MSAREVALLTLSAMERQNAWSNGHLKKAIRDAKLDRRDAALATRICFGVLQNRILLDYYIGHFSTFKLDKMESKVRNNLRIGLYQMLFLTRVPQNAAVNEAVKLTRKHSKNPKASGMVNGILRNLGRNLHELPSLEQGNTLETLALRYSHPQWLVREFLTVLPESDVEKLLESNNNEPPLTLQVNLCRGTTKEAISVLEKDGVTVKKHPWLTDCLLVSETGDLEQLEAYRKGWIYVQDPAARLAVIAAGLKPEDRVLDACAAPGGKSFGAAIEMKNRGEIISCDIHAHKKKLLEAGAQRLGLSCISPCIMNAKIEQIDWQSAFDVVLADVPCSGLGVIRKKPEIRDKNPKDLEGLSQVQTDIVNNVSHYVKPGGVLLYSTCTLCKKENEDIVTSFLQRHPGFHLESFELPGVGEVRQGMVTLWPHRLNTDGFFIAKLRRSLC